jgi:hypothetical protein
VLARSKWWSGVACRKLLLFAVSGHRAVNRVLLSFSIVCARRSAAWWRFTVQLTAPPLRTGETGGPDDVGAANGRCFTRVIASMYPQVNQLRQVYLKTATDVVNAATSAVVESHIETQGHVLTAGGLIRALAVEATIHHLDMIVRLPSAPGPSSEGLAQVRWCLDGLLGHPAPVSWPAAH